MMEPQEDFFEYGVTRELFNEWRSPRLGDDNPTRMDNPVWKWLIRSKHSAYAATQLIGGPSPVDVGPCWCFDRFGQSSTTLLDGRKVYIAGEHEDHYDPDFYIYNDVVVESVGGAITVYGYPKECFPPTDFHSATLVDSEIIIIGNLGYPEIRESALTQVLSLNTQTFVISKLATSGEMPGWIHRHKAILSDDGASIIVTGGEIDRGPDYSLIENINDWSFNIRTRVWECVTRRSWPRWEISKPSKTGNHLWEIRQALWNLEVGWKEDYEKAQSSLASTLGQAPDVRSVQDLYRPDLPHDVMPEQEEEYGVYRVRIEGVTVRYVEESHCVQITVEGELPELTARRLVEDVRSKLEALENTEYGVSKIV